MLFNFLYPLPIFCFLIFNFYWNIVALVAQMVKNLPTLQETWV